MSWERPAPSLASARAAPRTTLRCFLPRSGISEFAARLSCKELAKALQGLRCTVGLRATYLDKSALLVDGTDWEALHPVDHLCEDILPVSPRVALIHTGVLANIWEGVLTDMMRNNPTCCILKLRWRQSYHGGRPWAQPAATTAQMQAVKTQVNIRLQGRTPGAGRDLESLITFPGNLGPEPEALVGEVMKSIASRLGAVLFERPVGENLEPGHWCMLKHPGSQDPTGRARIRLSNRADAEKLEKAINAQPVYVGGETLAIQVSNPALMKLPFWQGNGQGAQLRGGPPPGT